MDRYPRLQPYNYAHRHAADGDHNSLEHRVSSLEFHAHCDTDMHADGDKYKPADRQLYAHGHADFDFGIDRHQDIHTFNYRDCHVYLYLYPQCNAYKYFC
jgi:hypothetical protein